jgi:hypothetical protein
MSGRYAVAENTREVLISTGNEKYMHENNHMHQLSFIFINYRICSRILRALILKG